MNNNSKNSYTINEVFEREPQWYILCIQGRQIVDIKITEMDLERGQERIDELVKLFIECNRDPDNISFEPCDEEYARAFRNMGWLWR